MSYTRKLYKTPATALTIALLTAAPLAHATNLLDIYDRAAQSDPQIRAAEANRLATREARPQAWSSFLPNIAATADWSVSKSGATQQTLSNGQVTNIGAMTSRGGSYGISATEEINLPAMLRTLKRTDYTLAQADLTYHAAEQSLAVRVAQAYFSVLASKDVLNSAQASLEAFNRQLEQQEKRFEVGLSANTDVQEARASRDSANATVISAKRSLASAQEGLRVVAGELADTTLAAPADDIPLIIPEPQNQEQWVQKAMEGNLDLAASRISLEESTFDLGTLKTYRYPSVTLGASYVNSNSFNNFDVNNSVNSWNGTAFSIGIKVPIFSGGLVSSQIRQGVYQQRAARENLELSTRQTESSARDTYLSMESSIALVEADKQALESSRLALQATEAGFDVGTRTTIDVLTSRKNLLAAEVAYEQSRYTYITNLIALKQVTGSLTRADLEMINGWLTK